MNHNKWTESEEKALLGMAGRLSIRRAAAELKRSYRSVQEKIRRDNIPWNQGRAYVKDVAKMFGADCHTISHHRDKLGQSWRTHRNPRGPEDEELEALARSILDSMKQSPIVYSKKKVAKLLAISRGEW